MKNGYQDSYPNPITITDPYLIGVVHAIENLIPVWRRRLENGLVRLDFAVEIGRRLSAMQQEKLFEFLREQAVPPKYESKVLLAFSFNMPEWAVLEVLRLYKQAEKIRDTIVKYNDLMDAYEEIFYEEFEYGFLENQLPQGEQELAEVLEGYQKRMQELYERAPHFQQKYSYSRMYSDSSSSSEQTVSINPAHQRELHQLLGIPAGASEEEIKKQYRHLMKVLHPDSGGSAYLFTLVKKAYEMRE
jgi:hypothetical protein